jgi:predicted nuclease of predicted toxin-antitoxin system
MKILFDQNISFRLVKRITDIFPEAEQVRSLGLEDSTDQEIWNFANENEYTIITFDGDFYDLSLVWGHPPKIVWIRTGNKTTNEIESIVRKHQQNIEVFISDKELACLEIITA